LDTKISEKDSEEQLTVRKRMRNEKTVKEGVDLLKLDSDRTLGDLESSFELILVTLSKAFGLKPK
jgi:hypothetical protein